MTTAYQSPVAHVFSDALTAPATARERRFARGLKALSAFSDEYGHGNVPPGYVSADGFTLGNWIAVWRRKVRSGRYDQKQLDQVREFGFDPTPREDLWERGYAALVEFRITHGHAVVGRSYITEDGFKLGQWVGSRRQAWKAGSLTSWQVAALRAVGFVADTHEAGLVDHARWTRGLNAFAGFLDQHGHMTVPRGYVAPNGLYLSPWIATRRSEKRRGKLAPERVEILDLFGFIWDA